MGHNLKSVSVVLIVYLAIATASLSELEKFKQLKSKFLARQEVTEDVPVQTPYPPSGFKPAIPFSLPTDEKLVAPVNYYLPPLPAPAKFNVAPAEVYGPPAKTYGPPAKTYGPPEVTIEDNAEEVDDDQPVSSEVQPAEESPSSEEPREEEPELKQEKEIPLMDQSEEQPQETTPESVLTDGDEEPSGNDPDKYMGTSPLPDDSAIAGADSEIEPVPEENYAEDEPIAVEETISNALPERIVLARINGVTEIRSPKVKSARLKSAKLRLSPVVQLRRRTFSAQPIYLVGGSLYSYNGRVFRL